jgi:hypothetical protein
VTEPELRQAVTGLAGRLGLRWVYFGSDVRRGMEGDRRGLPDLLITGRAVLWAELKAPGKQPRAEQRYWHKALAAAGERVVVWQPAEWLTGEVHRELHQLAGGEYREAAPVTAEERMWRALRRDAGRR